MKFTVPLTLATPLILASTAAAASVAILPRTPMKTGSHVRGDVVLPPAGTWSKAGPLPARRDVKPIRRAEQVKAASRRAVPFGIASPMHAALAIRAATPDDTDDDAAFVDCQEWEEVDCQEGDTDCYEVEDPISATSADVSPEASTPVIDTTTYHNPKIQGAAQPVTADKSLLSAKSGFGSNASSSTTSSSNVVSSSSNSVATPSNLAPDSLTAATGCIRFHTVLPGEVCLGVLDGSKDLGLTLAQLYAYNPSLDSDCSNLRTGWAVCTGKNAA